MPHRAARCSWARQPDPHSVKRTQEKRERGTGAAAGDGVGELRVSCWAVVWSEFGVVRLSHLIGFRGSGMMV